MTIGEFSKRVGLSIDTLRYYDKIGILKPSRKGNDRDYSEVDVQEIAMVLRLKELNFSLLDILKLYEFETLIDMTVHINDETKESLMTVKGMIDEKYKDLLKREENLKVVKVALKKMSEKLELVQEKGGF